MNVHHSRFQKVCPTYQTCNNSNPCRSKSRFHSSPPADKPTTEERNIHIMAIPYSLTLRHVQPGEPEMGNKTFATAQYAEVMNLEALAEHMSSHGSKYDKGDIMAVATQLTSCIREQLLLGNKIVVGDLGSFYVCLVCDAADNAEAFSTALIKNVRVRWSPSTSFKDLINDASFTFVGSRKSQAAARKAERERLNAMATTQPGTDTNPDSGEGEDDGDGSLE